MFKLRLEFSLENQVIPNHLNIVFTSFLKKALEAYDPHSYQKMFVEKRKQIRTYTFSLKMYPKVREKGQTVLEQANFSVDMTDYNFTELLLFYNAFLMQLENKVKMSMYHNAMQLERISLCPSRPKVSDHVIVKMESPLIVKAYTDNGAQYLCSEDDNFTEALNRAVHRMLDDLSLPCQALEIRPLKVRKTVMSLYRFKTNATLGFFEIKGDPNIIAVLTLTGLGSCRSAGAGKFRIMG